MPRPGSSGGGRNAIQAILTPIFATAAALLAVAGALKLASPGALLPALGTLGVPGGAISARLLGALEVALGGAALSLPDAGTAAACACAYALFTAALIRLARVAPGLDCGCFGGALASAPGAGRREQRGGLRASGRAGAVPVRGAGAPARGRWWWRLPQAGLLRLGLNAVAVAVCAMAAATPVHGLAWLLARPALQAAALLAGIGGCVFCAYLCFTVLPAAWSVYGGARG